MDYTLQPGEERNQFETEFLNLLTKYGLGRDDAETITTAHDVTDYLQNYLKNIDKPKGLKRIDFETGFFIGKSGKKYFIEQSLSVERYKYFQEYEKEMGFGVSFKQLFDKLNELFDLVNKNQIGYTAVMLEDMRRGIAKLSERQPTMFKLAALYCNEENENRGVINQDMIDKKIADFADYDARDFFSVATNSVRGFIEIYNSVTQSIMQMPLMGDQ